MSPTEFASVLAGTVAIGWIITSVIRTAVLPSPERVWLTMLSFDVARKVSRWVVTKFDSTRSRRLLGAFAPTVLLTLPLVWSIGLIGAFAAIYWGITDLTVSQSIELSGSSLTTLGIADTPEFPISVLVIIEALLGLSILALMVGFLPTLYTTFSRREVAVGRLTIRAGSPPRPAAFFERLHLIGGLDQMEDLWEAWEEWFVELGETHTTFPPLVYFRSSDPERNWLTAAETALDAAAIARAAKLTVAQGQADTMIRAGYIALRAIADFYGIEPEAEPSALHQLSVKRSQFDYILDDIERCGIEIGPDRNELWSDFAGWRINYDVSITALSDLVGFVPTHWHHPPKPGNQSGNNTKGAHP